MRPSDEQSNRVSHVQTVRVRRFAVEFDKPQCGRYERQGGGVIKIKKRNRKRSLILNNLLLVSYFQLFVIF